jgi:Holliday junction resolvasome RuvABC DNA-binding subunit
MDLLKEEQILVELKQKVKEQEQKIAEFKAMPDDKKLAEILHEKQCHWNHTDGCGWHYESWNSMGYSRQEYLKKAREILKDFTFEQAIKFVAKM